jgi:hypothetical protein
MADQEVGHAVALTNMLGAERSAKMCIYEFVNIYCHHHRFFDIDGLFQIPLHHGQGVYPLLAAIDPFRRSRYVVLR